MSSCPKSCVWLENDGRKVLIKALFTVFADSSEHFLLFRLKILDQLRNLQVGMPRLCELISLAKNVYLYEVAINSYREVTNPCLLN